MPATSKHNYCHAAAISAAVEFDHPCSAVSCRWWALERLCSRAKAALNVDPSPIAEPPRHSHTPCTTRPVSLVLLMARSSNQTWKANDISVPSLSTSTARFARGHVFTPLAPGCRMQPDTLVGYAVPGRPCIPHSYCDYFVLLISSYFCCLDRVRVQIGSQSTECPLQVCQLSRSSESTLFLFLRRDAAIFYSTRAPDSF